MISKTPKPPYYAVIFTSLRTEVFDEYDKTSLRMIELAKKHDGFLGVESARNELGITISYWKSLESIKDWKKDPEHEIAQQKGKDLWYQSYRVRICKVEREYSFKSKE